MTSGCLIGGATGHGLLAPLDRAVKVAHEPPSHWGVWVLNLRRPIPVLSELSVLVAAAQGMRLHVLMLACSLAKLPVALAYGHFGAAFLGEVPVAYLLGPAMLLFVLGLFLRRRAADLRICQANLRQRRVRRP